MSTYDVSGGGPAFTSGPNPCRLDVSPARIERLHTAAARHKMIAEAAYLIAESRGFAPGHELSDWLAMECEVNRVCGLLDPPPHWDH
jgi:Protein of unknown function (DUF2934)